MNFGLIIIGDEILSGKRQDQHLSRVIDLLGQRGLRLSWARYVGDEPERITAELRLALASGEVVFSCGGIGATPDDHTRACAAAACGRTLELHPQAAALITERMQEVARERGEVFEPQRADNQHRLQMGVFPKGAQIIRNPYNKIPGFTLPGVGQGRVHFLPGFPVMAWPMIEALLDNDYAALHQSERWCERSVIVRGAMESLLTPLMEEVEAQFPGVKVFSLPSVDHPQWGAHIDLGVKGLQESEVEVAFAKLRQGLELLQMNLGPEMVR
jgi:molybdopterin-biosynthesis enzyme MoeA-like protein